MARYLDIFFFVGGNVVINSLYFPHVIVGYYIEWLRGKGTKLAGQTGYDQRNNYSYWQRVTIVWTDLWQLQGRKNC